MSLTKVFKKELDIWKVYENEKIFFTWDVLPSIWENGNGFKSCFKSGTHEMFKIRVDLKFQILVPVLM
ncbi:unnamed protein product [Rhizophagus irregularis]|nr:unnamed protein product [Rhizophagus irregularis]CAB4425886.1 unnamed protein product [Rhizophagus irregularis]